MGLCLLAGSLTAAGLGSAALWVPGRIESQVGPVSGLWQGCFAMFYALPMVVLDPFRDHMGGGTWPSVMTFEFRQL